ncbi:MAG: hypothetical protein CBB94_16790 [Gammaproteobacteria bacterium TMED34]|nr:MAG: hypothetical protein CBB94_16790 [Gammaproteobacteria bacterium TMED34]
MAMIVNTNVSSLTAQRSLAQSSNMLDSAMERLSTGSKINSASDDAAGLAIVQRMTAQINGLAMAVKNANDGIALTQSVEGALVEVSDMLQRLRELSVQAANATNTDIDRNFIQEEVNLLLAEISRVSSNTRFNNQPVLDGTFLNKQLQVGTEGGEVITMSVDSVSASALGSYQITGDRIEAQAGDGAGSYANITDATDDIILNGNSISKTIDVAAADSAKNVAAKINAVSGELGVTATAKTYALLNSEYATDQTYSILVNNVTTGSFVISSSNVTDAVDKINAISGSTGVTAQATNDFKVRLYAQDGADILVESQTSGQTALRMQSVSHDGTSVQPSQVWHRATADTTGGSGAASAARGELGAADGTYTLVQKSTGQTWTFAVSSATTSEPTAAELQADLNGITGVSGFKVAAITSNATDLMVTATEEFGAFEIYSGTDITASTTRQTFSGVGKHIEIATGSLTDGSKTWVIRNDNTGKTYEFTFTADQDVANTNIDNVEAALHAHADLIGFSAYADHTTDTTLHIHGSAEFGDWTLVDTSDSAIANVTENHAGGINNFDLALAAGGSSNDAVTVQGTISLASSKSFSVTQSAEETNAVTDPDTATGGLTNDNYFVTRAADLSTISNVDLRTTSGAGAAITVLDGAIEKVSSMRADLGAIENRLSHTVSNLMNVAENTADARSRINDADYSIESANLAKSQVLQQAGAAMLAQANARSQLVLQLLQ